MRIRLFSTARMFLLFCMGLMTACFLHTPKASLNTRPNIIFLLTDDQRWDALGCMGNRIIQTPNLDRLASEGTLFVNNFCTTAICAVSRASIFTGQYARRHGINDFSTPLSAEQLAASYPVLLRRAAGYRTGFIGKWGLGGDLPVTEFDYFRGFPGQGSYDQTREGKPIHLTRLQGEQAVEFLNESSRDKPFCLSISFKAPHVEDGAKERLFRYDPAHEGLYKDVTIAPPKTADPKYREALPEFIRNSEGHTRWQKEFSHPTLYQESARSIYRLVTGVDEVVGRIVETLKEIGQAENTIIIFTSDNGFFMGERGLEGKWLMYEESIRTPLIVYDPRLPKSNRGKRTHAMTLNLDLAPTMLEYAGITAPPQMQGKSLVPLITQESAPALRTEWFYEHLFDFGGKIPQTEGVRTERWKYARYIATEPPYEELFDLERDPFEEHNLVKESESEYSEVIHAMRDKWRQLREQCR